MAIHVHEDARENNNNMCVVHLAFYEFILTF